MNVIGDASYSIYLSHAIVFSAIGVVLGRLTLFETNWPLVVLMLVGAVAWGFVSYFLIERPGLAAIRRF